MSKQSPGACHAHTVRTVAAGLLISSQQYCIGKAGNAPAPASQQPACIGVAVSLVVLFCQEFAGWSSAAQVLAIRDTICCLLAISQSNKSRRITCMSHGFLSTAGAYVIAHCSLSPETLQGPEVCEMERNPFEGGCSPGVARPAAAARG